MESFNIKTKQDANNAIIKMVGHEAQGNIIIRTAEEIIKLVKAQVSKNDTLWCTIERQNLITGTVFQDDLTDNELVALMITDKGMCIQF